MLDTGYTTTFLCQASTLSIELQPQALLFKATVLQKQDSTPSLLLIFPHFTRKCHAIIQSMAAGCHSRVSYKRDYMAPKFKCDNLLLRNFANSCSRTTDKKEPSVSWGILISIILSLLSDQKMTKDGAFILDNRRLK